MIRKIVTIDENKCTGCGLCVTACHEGALRLVDGKARLISETYCDGLGACLPECPAGAITVQEREAEAFDQAAVESQVREQELPSTESQTCGCPGSQARMIAKRPAEQIPTPAATLSQSELRQWPCQIKLVPVDAPYFENARLLVAADCTAYAYANIHQEFMRNKITLIGCPKLDADDYSEKLTEILKRHQIKSVTVLRMEVPCCGGISHAVQQALQNSGKMIPWNVVIIGTDGSIIEA